MNYLEEILNGISNTQTNIAKLGKIDKFKFNKNGIDFYDVVLFPNNLPMAIEVPTCISVSEGDLVALLVIDYDISDILEDKTTTNNDVGGDLSNLVILGKLRGGNGV